jgi:hypothetical protein
MSRDLREESSALHALGMLAGEELARFRQEWDEDPALREMSRVLREVTSHLVHWAPPHTPPEALRERLLEGIDSSRGDPEGPARDPSRRGPAG